MLMLVNVGCNVTRVTLWCYALRYMQCFHSTTLRKHGMVLELGVLFSVVANLHSKTLASEIFCLINKQQLVLRVALRWDD